MIQIISAQETTSLKACDVVVFLLGDSKNESHNEIIKSLSDFNNYGDVVVYNPFCESYDAITKWEHNAVRKADLLAVFITDESETVVNFYKLGSGIEIIKKNFPNSWRDRIVISCSSNFSHFNELKKLVELSTDGEVAVNESCDYDELMKNHVKLIKERLEIIA